MYEEDDLIPISALNQYMYCPRRAALIHIEGLWEENRFTVEGTILHERVHETDDERRGGVRIVRGLRLRSLRVGLSGQADVVEFHRNADGGETPFPVEYKRGRPKPNRMDEVQLCAQALCLEEMLGVAVTQGALFYGAPRRRHDVAIDASLRGETEALAARMHALFAAGTTPPPVYEKKCDNCSLCNQCMPKYTENAHSARKYLDSVWKGLDADTPAKE